MAGIYFIAAGSSSRNRQKSIDHGLQVDAVEQHLEPRVQQQLADHFEEGDLVYAWGANELGDLDKLGSGDYVVDVKNTLVVQIFCYVFNFETHDTRLQEWIGWDAEKPRNERRAYNHVYFLRDPQETVRTEKSYFQRAFGQEGNQNWLVRQRWFSDSDLRSALELTNTKSVESLLGIDPGDSPTIPPKPDASSEVPTEPDRPTYLRPVWLLPVIEQVEHLRDDDEHLEREHEDVVVRLFEILGYARGQEIKLQRGRVDILITETGESRPIIVVEAKRDWTLSRKDVKSVRQAHVYGLDTGTPWVILTNGDLYILYDRRAGLSYEDQFVGEFTLTRLTQNGVVLLSNLYKGTLS